VHQASTILIIDFERQDDARRVLAVLSKRWERRGAATAGAGQAPQDEV